MPHQEPPIQLATAAHAAAYTLRTEQGDVLGDDARRELLNKLKAGESFELLLDFVAYSQAPGVQNRKYVRFAHLEELAATGAGTRFLRDHDQHRMKAVGGTVIESRLHANGAAMEIHQTALLVEKWALRAALHKLMSAFSIGWNPIPTPGKPAPEVQCTVCQAPVSNCLHWRGSVVGDQVVEYLFLYAELLESSAVPIGAVREARPIGVRQPSASALAAELSAYGLAVDVPESISLEDSKHMNEIALALGLPADATEAVILAALKERESQAGKVAAELATAKADAKLALEREVKLAGEVDALKLQVGKAAGELADEKARTWADGLVQAGKLTAEGWMFDAAVAQYKKDPAAAERLAATMPIITPVGRQLQSDNKAATTATTTPTGEPDFALLATKLDATDQKLVQLSKCTGAEFVKANYPELAKQYGWPEMRS